MVPAPTGARGQQGGSSCSGTSVTPPTLAEKGAQVHAPGIRPQSCHRNRRTSPCHRAWHATRRTAPPWCRSASPTQCRTSRRNYCCHGCTAVGGEGRGGREWRRHGASSGRSRRAQGWCQQPLSQPCGQRQGGGSDACTYNRKTSWLVASALASAAAPAAPILLLLKLRGVWRRAKGAAGGRV